MLLLQHHPSRQHLPKALLRCCSSHGRATRQYPFLLQGLQSSQHLQLNQAVGAGDGDGPELQGWSGLLQLWELMPSPQLLPGLTTASFRLQLQPSCAKTHFQNKGRLSVHGSSQQQLNPTYRMELSLHSQIHSI